MTPTEEELGADVEPVADLARYDDLLLFVPAHPTSQSTPDLPGTFALEPRTMSDGTTAAIAFSSVEALVSQLGRFQPWVGVPPRQLVDICRATGVTHVRIDPRVYPFEPRWREQDLEMVWKDAADE